MKKKIIQNKLKSNQLKQKWLNRCKKSNNKRKWQQTKKMQKKWIWGPEEDKDCEDSKNKNKKRKNRDLKISNKKIMKI